MRIFYLLMLAFSLQAVSAQAEPVLHKGVNLSSWLANAQRQPLFTRDYLLIKEAGFDHVRLPFNPEYYGLVLAGGKEAKGPGAMNFLPLDRALGLATQNGLAVILDVHGGFDFLARLEHEPQAEVQFIALWKALAERYKDYPADMLAFELLNEPQYYNDAERYHDLADKLVKAIRSIDKKHLIILGGPGGASIDGLLAFQPIEDVHIAYDFHFYEPVFFTHQGINKGFEKTVIRSLHHVPYPSTLATGNAHAYADKSANISQVQSELQSYREEDWNADHIAMRIERAKDWADVHHVRILCGEFGVLRRYSDAGSRYRWIHDVRTALEERGIGWDVWDYTDGFGIAELHGKIQEDPDDGSVRFIDPQKGSRAIESQAIIALGLK